MHTVTTSDGTEIFVNKTDADWTDGKITIPAKGYQILRPKAG